MTNERNSIFVALGMGLLAGLLATLGVLLFSSSMAVAADESAPDLLPGVDLVTEEVEPGVYRVLSDGVRDLVRLADRDHWTNGILDGNVVAGLDGSVWWFDRDGFHRLGEAGTHHWPKSSPSSAEPTSKFFSGQADIEVGPDGSIWLTGWSRDILSYDGEAWSKRWRGSAKERAYGVEVQQDGSVWMAWFRNQAKKGEARSGPVRAARLGDGDWEVVPGTVKGRVAYGDVVIAEGGGNDLRLRPLASGRLHRHDAEGWVVEETPDLGGVALPAVGPDGTLWVRLIADCLPGSGCSNPSDILARLDGEDWEVYDSSDGIPMMGDHYMGFEGFFEVAPDRSIWFNPIGDHERTGTECDGIANFDGEAITSFLPDTCIYAMDLAPDGTVWLQAGEWPRADDPESGPIRLYVITPEAVAGTE